MSTEVIKPGREVRERMRWNGTDTRKAVEEGLGHSGHRAIVILYISSMNVSTTVSMLIL